MVLKDIVNILQIVLKSLSSPQKQTKQGKTTSMTYLAWELPLFYKGVFLATLTFSKCFVMSCDGLLYEAPHPFTFDTMFVQNTPN
jgi:hypothetical protein